MEGPLCWQSCCTTELTHACVARNPVIQTAPWCPTLDAGGAGYSTDCSHEGKGRGVLANKIIRAPGLAGLI